MLKEKKGEDEGEGRRRRELEGTVEDNVARKVGSPRLNGFIPGADAHLSVTVRG